MENFKAPMHDSSWVLLFRHAVLTNDMVGSELLGTSLSSQNRRHVSPRSGNWERTGQGEQG